MGPHGETIQIEPNKLGFREVLQMSKSTDGIWPAIRRQLMSHRHTAMLSALVALIAVRPLIGDGHIADGVYLLVLVVVMVFALYAIQHDELVGEEGSLRAEHRRDSMIGGTLAVSATALRFATFYSPDPSIVLIGQICWMLFFGFIAWKELRAVLRQKQITNEAISMAISVYLLLGVTWSLLYDVIHQLQPLAFSLNGSASALVAAGHPIFPVLAYFSFITLTTIGYGDIAPLTLQARYAALAEGVVGQFYLAILVARLVSMQLVQMAAPRSPGDSSSDSTSSADYQR
jgi:hypothetical protein